MIGASLPELMREELMARLVAIGDRYLASTPIIDSDHPSIMSHAAECTSGCRSPVEMSIRLYYAVRDPIIYDPYLPFYRPEHYRASAILAKGRGFCVPKASLLCALGRSCGIPTRLGFADVKNHLASTRFLEMLGSDLFVYHGYVEFYLEGQWVKATPSFNRELCELHGVEPLEFNGREDSIFHEFNREDRPFMEYVTDHGVFDDVPVASLVAAWQAAYGEERVAGWVAKFEARTP